MHCARCNPAMPGLRPSSFWCCPGVGGESGWQVIVPDRTQWPISKGAHPGNPTNCCTEPRAHSWHCRAWHRHSSWRSHRLDTALSGSVKQSLFEAGQVPYSLSIPCAEVGALGGALTHQDRSGRSAALLSVKSVYGHTEGAAGKASQLCQFGQTRNHVQIVHALQRLRRYLYFQV